MNLARMGVFEQPGSIALLFGTNQLNRFAHPRIVRATDRAEIFQSAQHIVMPARGKRESQPRRVHDLTSTLSANQIPFYKILFSATSRRDRFGRPTRGAFVLQESFQN